MPGFTAEAAAVVAGGSPSRGYRTPGTAGAPAAGGLVPQSIRFGARPSRGSSTCQEGCLCVTQEGCPCCPPTTLGNLPFGRGSWTPTWRGL